MDISANGLKEKYIYIFSGGLSFQGGEPEPEDYETVDKQELQILHPSTMTTYCNGAWVDIEEI